MNIVRVLVLLCCILAPSALAQYPQPHAGWKLVPGGENLISSGYWNSTDMGGPPQTVSVVSGVLTANATGGYFGAMNPLAPRLVTTGDWGAIATFLTSPGTNGLFTLFGSLNTGSQYWQGMTEIECGIDNSGNYVFAYWDGTSASPASYNVLKTFPSASTGTVTVELLHQAGQFTMYFNGTQYGPVKDPGVFTTGYILPGFELFPNQKMQMTQYAFEVPASDTVAKIGVPISPYSYANQGSTPGSLAAATGRILGTSFSVWELALGREGNSPGPTGGVPDVTVGPKAASQYSGFIAATMYYSETEPAQNDFRLSDGDALIAASRANGLQVHCHHLIGPNIYLPGWLTTGAFTAAQLSQILVNHIQTVMGHYKGQCASWDVVNEALASDGTVSTSANIWAQVIGPSYIDLAFQTARQVDPAAKLYYNDYYVENQTPKAVGMYPFLAGMQQRGVPIDGVGLQCHWIQGNADPNWQPQHDSMVANMAQLAKMGLSVRISELDSRILLPASSAALATQATIFSTTVQACLDSPNCTGVWFWGADDSLSWIPGFYPGYGAATLFDTSFNPKPGTTSLMNTLSAAPKAKSAITSVHTTSGGTTIAQNTYIEIKGANLVPSTTPASGVIWSSAPSFQQGQMPTQLGGVSVTVNGQPAFVYFYCSAATSACKQDQINVLTPLDNTTGPVPIIVTSGSTVTAAFTATMAATVPTPLLFNPLGPIVATHLNYTLAGSAALYPGYSTPAAPGETVAVYAVGLGLPTTPLTNGSSTQTGSLPYVPSCTVGGLSASVAAVLVSPGLYQLNLTIPPSAQSGDNPVACTYNGVSTPAGAFITVQQ
ncbi:MAG TPA: endo-1,4-beta-xylanase [Bryobacteraceae bacterium]|nr:endo-1,4-beta-xylanase [Bryobacteraceae bacterium]